MRRFKGYVGIRSFFYGSYPEAVRNRWSETDYNKFAKIWNEDDHVANIHGVVHFKIQNPDLTLTFNLADMPVGALRDRFDIIRYEPADADTAQVWAALFPQFRDGAKPETWFNVWENENFRASFQNPFAAHEHELEAWKNRKYRQKGTAK